MRSASAMRSLSGSQARRIALEAQGFSDPRPSGRVDRRHMRRVMGRLRLLQLDSVPVVMRSHYLPAFSRLGPYDPALADAIAYADDEWFEAWCHEASLLAVSDEPLLRWQKQRARRGETWAGLAQLARDDPGYIAEVLAQVRERPLAPSELADPRPRSGQWWGDRSVGSLALDWLFRIGEVGIRRRPGFAKEFDLIERIVHPAVLARPTPSEEDAQRALLLQAAGALGVAAAADLVDYHRLPKRPAAQRLRELVDNGDLEEVTVQGWDRPGYLAPSARLPRSVDACTLLSPFDPLVWFRPRAARLFDFAYKIEIYTPRAQRVHGYYVLPLLLGERLVGRVDLKTDRAAGVLRVLGAFGEAQSTSADEPRADHDEVSEGLRRALDDLAVFVGAEGWAVSGSAGDLVGCLI